MVVSDGAVCDVHRAGVANATAAVITSAAPDRIPTDGGVDYSHRTSHAVINATASDHACRVARDGAVCDVHRGKVKKATAEERRVVGDGGVDEIHRSIVAVNASAAGVVNVTMIGGDGAACDRQTAAALVENAAA